MKSLFQNIRAGVITKPACEAQLAKFKTDKMTLTRTYLARQLGSDLYTKKLAEMNFCVEMLQAIIDKWDDLILPLKITNGVLDSSSKTLDDNTDAFINEGGIYDGQAD